MVEFMLVPGYFKEKIELSQEVLDRIKCFKKIALFGSVQFITLERVEEQLTELSIKIIAAHGKRTSGKYQLLGCDCFANSFSEDISHADAILYIGDGLFHPKALILAQKKIDVIQFNPRTTEMSVLTQADLEKQLKKYKANLTRYVASKKIGILVSTKTGQQYLKNALLLKEKADKEYFVFVGDTFDFSEMENYPFIECWVNTACPRIGFDDIAHMPKPLININDALDPIQALENVK
ncbi:2-(3-amino-3-carboxypropyl)histidine synthase [Candidatus Woesearchaeota archaeon]|nr:2-(3-amino-3-carboxypropyl)histidine synthase [Candidatus Woesearchaeota archaeon]